MLDRRKLARELLAVSRSMPLTVLDAADAWAASFVKYALDAEASGVNPTEISRNLIKSKILASPDFLSGFATGISFAWEAAPWTGASGSGKILVAQGLAPLLVAAAKTNLSVRNTTAEAAVDRLTSVIHSFTGKLLVTITPPSGQPFTAPVR